MQKEIPQLIYLKSQLQMAMVMELATVHQYEGDELVLKNK